MPRSGIWQTEVQLLRSWYDQQSHPDGFAHWYAFIHEYAALRKPEVTGRTSGDGDPLKAVDKRISRLGPAALIKADEWYRTQK